MPEPYPISLDIDYILKDNFLIADLFMEEKLRERLINATSADLKAIRIHLADKENAESLASIFKTGSYNAHVEVKKKNLTYSIVKETAVDLAGDFTGLSFVKTLSKAVHQLWETAESEEAVNDFIAKVQELENAAVLLEVIGADRDPRKHPGKMELAKDLVRAGECYKIFEKLDYFTQEELEEIRAAAK
ncbi:TPA: hypothetical protein ACTZ5W_002142 [Bacillus cereus]